MKSKNNSFHFLQKNHKNMIPGNQIYLDTETTFVINKNGDTEHELKLGVAIFVCYDKKLRRKNRTVKHFTSTEQIWNFIKRHSRDKTKLVVFAHNIFFDLWISQIYPQAFAEGWRSKIPYSKGMVYLDSIRKGKQTIAFINTGNFFQTTVKKMGNMVGAAKGDVDFNIATNSELAKYCERDTEIIEKAMLQWFTFLRKNDMGNFAQTLAGQAMNAFRHRFMKVPIYIHRDKQPADLEKAAYFGGRCEAFYIGKVKAKKIYKLDINSMYPGVMKVNYFPVRFRYKKEKLAVNRLPEFLKDNCLVAQVKLKTDIPAYPKKYEKRLIFPVGTFETTLCTPELTYAYEHAHIVEIGECALYNRAIIFDKYVETLYKLRQHFKAMSNEIFDYASKILLNSLYGKFAQKQRENEIEDYPDKNQVSSKIIINADSESITREVCFGGSLKKSTMLDVESYHSFTGISAHVTSYARRKIQEVLDILPKKSYFYGDTDSLFVSKTGMNAMKNEIDETELGKWKIEEISDNVVIRGLKDYTFGESTKLKGVQDIKKRISENVFESTTWPGFPLVFERKLTDPYIVKAGIKTLTRKYHKGTVNKSGWVKPFIFQDDILQ